MEFNDIMKKGFKTMFNEDISDVKLEKFIKYKELLIDWNEKINLTSITGEKDIAIKHFLDSLSIYNQIDFKPNSKIIDMGTGAGFPGGAMAIYNKDLNFTLVDSLNKRIKFLEILKADLELNNIELIHSRAEDLGRNLDYRESYDYGVSRAVASLDVLVEYILPFIKVGGFLISQKGPKIYEEIEGAKKAINVLGGEIYSNKEIELPFSNRAHTILIIKKVKKTPKKYPRNPGKPSKSPIK